MSYIGGLRFKHSEVQGFINRSTGKVLNQMTSNLKDAGFEITDKVAAQMKQRTEKTVNQYTNNFIKSIGGKKNITEEKYNELIEGINNRVAQGFKDYGVTDELSDLAGESAKEFALHGERAMSDLLPIAEKTKVAIKRDGFVDGISKAWHNDDGSIRPLTVARDVGGVAITANAIHDGVGILDGRRTLKTDETGQQDTAFIPFI